MMFNLLRIANFTRHCCHPALYTDHFWSSNASTGTASHKSSDGLRVLALGDGKQAVSDSTAKQKQLRFLVNLRDQEGREKSLGRLPSFS